MSETGEDPSAAPREGIRQAPLAKVLPLGPAN
jgi:hypothetical protein